LIVGLVVSLCIDGIAVYGLLLREGITDGAADGIIFDMNDGDIDGEVDARLDGLFVGNEVKVMVG